MGSTSRKCEVRGRVEGDQFRLLGVAVQLLEEEENESGHRSLFVAHVLLTS